MVKYTLPDAGILEVSDLRVRYGDEFDPNTVTRWQKNGRISKVKNGLYVTPEQELLGSWDWFVLSHRLYQPSYISTISALRLYNFIPETVYGVTAITTRKTRRMTYRGKLFRYQTIRPRLFFGYTVENWKDAQFYLASPEKALIDLVYLDGRYSDPDWIEEMRFDYEEMHERIDQAKLDAYVRFIKSPTVAQRITMITKNFAEC